MLCPCRGPPPEYGFGTPLYGSCGYLSQEGNQGVDFSNVPFPVDMLSAVANINDDYPGSCGRYQAVLIAFGFCSIYPLLVIKPRLLRINSCCKCICLITVCSECCHSCSKQISRPRCVCKSPTSWQMIVAIDCRCYEIQCSTGVVTGNYSTASGTPSAIPYNTSTGFIEPGLDYDTVVDDYNRKWNGNPLMSQNELFTQCWNGSQVYFSLMCCIIWLLCHALAMT